ncbi:nucleoside triphosphate pyrophosphohydrolase family protein [Marinobacterium litorale]|uniref:nucleoside triphosphate pyrophosphohydrolase family protein n=1 Tax=Marinobacterium litorale TaxID=404770 RepID=UPI000409C375|nr:nucleoside triphosphate pyrophosphohydrolase family protein [Marinobacterium litorale]
MSNFSDVSFLNTLIGNPQGNLEALDWVAVEAQLGLIEEEFNELKKAVQERNIEQVRDGASDVLVTTYGLQHRAGIDADADMAEVQASNLSKFCKSHSEAEQTAMAYEKLGLDVTFRTPTLDLITVISAKDQTGSDGKFYPKGKLLKSVNFKEPSFS